jgi:hypothetical protein
MSDTYERIQMVLAGLCAIVFGLSALSRRFPHIAWLQHFRNPFPRPSEEQRAKMRRRSNFDGGVQLILLGLALPLGYGALTVMTFGSFDRTEIAFVLGGSVLCIGLGFTAIWKSRRGKASG